MTNNLMLDEETYEEDFDDYNNNFFSPDNNDEKLLLELSDKIQYIDRDDYESFIKRKSLKDTLIYYVIALLKIFIYIGFSMVLTVFIILQADVIFFNIMDIQPDWGMLFVPFILYIFIKTYDTFSPIKILF